MIAEQFVEDKWKNSDYGNGFLHKLNQMRTNQENCDFSLEVGGETLYVHRVALAVTSPYFAAMFRNNTKEKAMGSMELEDNDATAVKAIIDYIYSGEITLTEANVQLVYLTADYFQIEWIKKKCVEFFKSKLNPTNCFQMRRFVGESIDLCKRTKHLNVYCCLDKPPFEELYECSHNYILKHFDKLIHKEELLRLSFEEIEELVKDDRLAVAFEDNAFKAIMKWVKYDLEERKGYLAELMSLIRFPFIRNEFLRGHVINETLLKNDPHCNEFLTQLCTYRLTSVSKRSPDQTRNISKNRNARFHVLLSGGEDVKTGWPQRKCRVFNVSNSKICSISDMVDRRNGNSVISLNDVVYSVGGYDEDVLESAEYYDQVSRKWIHIEPMNRGRVYFGICAHNSLIYAIGGAHLSSVESYNASTGKWYACPNTPVAYEWWCRAAVVENSIYSLGRGTDGVTSCIRFDPREGRWYKLNEIPGRPLNGFELFSYDRSLFFIEEKCARLDIRTNKWDSMLSMLSQRFYYSAAVIADDIYVFGGGLNVGSRVEHIKTVERYNMHNNEWTIVDTIEIESFDGAAALITGDFNLD
uniref:Kelch-like protein diablo n=1 Tax=Glossina morsitans morsitans TaxID=37546 RepID=A0A1B0FGV3_GLOMM